MRPCKVPSGACSPGCAPAPAETERSTHQCPQVLGELARDQGRGPAIAPPMLDLNVIRKHRMSHKSSTRHGASELHHGPRHVIAAGDQAEAGEGAVGHPGGGLTRVRRSVLGLVAELHAASPERRIVAGAQLRAFDPFVDAGDEEGLSEAALRAGGALPPGARSRRSARRWPRSRGRVVGSPRPPNRRTMRARRTRAARRTRPPQALRARCAAPIAECPEPP